MIEIATQTTEMAIWMTWINTQMIKMAIWMTQGQQFYTVLSGNAQYVHHWQHHRHFSWHTAETSMHRKSWGNWFGRSSVNDCLGDHWNLHVKSLRTTFNIPAHPIVLLIMRINYLWGCGWGDGGAGSGSAAGNTGQHYMPMGVVQLQGVIMANAVC